MTSVDWRPLDAALERLDGAALPLWIRDDDAIEPTSALERLLAFAERFDAPIAIASIPDLATSALAERLSKAPKAIVLPHGWRHQSHAPADQKKAEFGAHRPLEAMAAEIAEGWARIQTLFGAQARPIFTPPWNRVAPDLAPRLPALGITALSTFGPRKAREAAPGLAQVNTHIDPIQWKGSRSLVPPETLIQQIAALIDDRREGRADAVEPLGLLTHHLVHDEAVWGFCETLLERLAARATLDWARL